MRDFTREKWFDSFSVSHWSDTDFSKVITSDTVKEISTTTQSHSQTFNNSLKEPTSNRTFTIDLLKIAASSYGVHVSTTKQWVYNIGITI